MLRSALTFGVTPIVPDRYADYMQPLVPVTIAVMDGNGESQLPGSRWLSESELTAKSFWCGRDKWLREIS